MRILGLQTQHPTFIDRSLAKLAHPCTSESERELALYADHLDALTANRMDAALLLATPQARAKALADVLEGAQGKSDARCLFAAAVEGVRQLEKASHEPLLELTKAAVESGDHVVRGAMEGHLESLTRAACVGLNAYAENPRASMLGVAADMEDQVGTLLDDIIPTLTRYDGDIANPLEVLRLADAALESNGSLYSCHSAGPWMRELQVDTHPSVPRTFAIALKDDWLDESDACDVFYHCHETYDKSGEIREFASAQRDQIAQGRAKDTLVNEWRRA